MNKILQSNHVTIMDVAREAGVSYSTVSRVVNKYQFVKPSTRQKVEEAMEQLGYVANIKARSLAGGQSRVLGVLVHELNTSYNVEIIRGMDTAVSELSYDFMLSTTHKRRQKESTYVKQLMQGLVDGLLIILPRNQEFYLPDLYERNFPHILIDYAGTDNKSNTIIATNRQGNYDATMHLIELGHRRIGMITGSMEAGSAQARLAGYKEALTESGLPIDPGLVVEGDFLKQKGYENTRKLLALPHPPTAILASSDLAAFGAMRAIQEANLRVPHDLSVIGFDDVPEASYILPLLTTVRQPLQEMGRLATEILIENIEDPQLPPQQIKLPTELIIRESTAPPPVA